MVVQQCYSYLRLTSRTHLAAPPESVPGTGGGHEPSSAIGNTFALQGAFGKLDIALNEVIATLEAEESAVGSSASQQTLISKFKSWQAELSALRGGVNRFSGRTMDRGTPQEGGLFAD